MITIVWAEIEAISSSVMFWSLMFQSFIFSR
jgi:hypothetical protein